MMKKALFLMAFIFIIFPLVFISCGLYSTAYRYTDESYNETNEDVLVVTTVHSGYKISKNYPYLITPVTKARQIENVAFALFNVMSSYDYNCTVFGYEGYDTPKQLTEKEKENMILFRINVNAKEING